MSDTFGINGNFKAASDGMRNAPRESLFLLGKLYVPEKPAVDVRVRNLSATGMMVESPILAQMGEIVFIEIKGLGKLEGKIAWIAERRMGIALGEEIDPRDARQSIGTRTPPRA